MNNHLIHHQFAPHKFLFPVDPDDFMPMRTMKKDSCWEEHEFTYDEESLPSHVLGFFGSAAYD